MEYTTIKWRKENNQPFAERPILYNTSMCIIRQSVTQLTSLQINNTHIHTQCMYYIHVDTNS